MTQDELKALFVYDAVTGIFVRRQSRSSNAAEGAVAGTVQNKGYITIWINGRRYMAHRLAWLYSYGNWPPNMIDHINGIKSDNRLSNLRLANNSLNQQNLKSTLANKSGVIGVLWHKAAKKWMANIVVNKKAIYLGLFEDFDEAVAARRTAEVKYHPFAPPIRALKDA